MDKSVHLQFKRRSIRSNSKDEAKVMRQADKAAAGCDKDHDDDDNANKSINNLGRSNSYYGCRRLLLRLNILKHEVHSDSVLLDGYNDTSRRKMTSTVPVPSNKGASWFARWSAAERVSMLIRHHPLPCVLTLFLLFFMGVEYTLRMVPPSSPPIDIGFFLTRSLHGLLASRPILNSFLAALNTVFVGMQTTYILWTLLVEGRPRSTIAALFMFPCRGVLGYSTQLPLPQGFLGSGADFPVGNVSFFLFFSGHVAGSVIASVDMRRMRRQKMAWTFDTLNILQMLRLLATRGHYTIDLAVGVGAGFLFDILAGKYEDSKKHYAGEFQRSEKPCCTCSSR